MNNKLKEAFVLGIFLFLGFSALGYFIAASPAKFRQYERTVNVKGLSEREVPADVVIWPIRFSRASNDLSEMYQLLESDAGQITALLGMHGFADSDVSVTPPFVTDKIAQHYGNQNIELRYTAQQTVTVYSKDVERVRRSMRSLAQLGKNGIVFVGHARDNSTEYIFTGLNELKPEMVEEATRKAREVAEKFAIDSDSKLGKIKSARQGQFSVTSRDKNNPQFKKVRVVSTIEYYLSD